MIHKLWKIIMLIDFNLVPSFYPFEMFPYTVDCTSDSRIDVFLCPVFFFVYI